MATLVGQKYEVSFCFGTVEDGGRDGTAQIDVWADAAHQVFTISNHTKTLVWEPRQFLFQATSSTTTILLSYIGPRNEHFAFIDNVALIPVEPVPAHSPWSLWVLGLALLAALTPLVLAARSRANG